MGKEGSSLDGTFWCPLALSPGYSLLSAYGIQLNPTCRESIILSLENDGGFLYPLIDK
jgi:hypothetical protein